MTQTDQPIISNRYILQDKLGAGGMGVVYRALDRLTGETVALKRVLVNSTPTDSSNTSDYLARIAAEFRTLAGLRHPHIVRVLGYGFSFENEQLQPYFTMEYLPDASTLTQAAANQPLEMQVRLLTEMLLALTYLHRRGIIHHDLKPDNVLVDSSGRVRVLDFGLAAGMIAQSITDFNERTAGTVAYMAPEFFRDEAASVRSDLYAAGMIAYEVFAGVYPFSEKNLMTLLNDIMNKAPDVAPLNPDLGDLLERLLAKDPLQRPNDAYQVIHALCAATNQPPPPESAIIRESFLEASRFVGRASEMEQLNTALDAAISPEVYQEAQVYLIGGESGVGKSRLLDELRTRALVKGALVLRGQGVAEGGLPYQLWRDAARELTLSTPLTDLEAGILKELVPDISLLIERETADPPELTGSAGQQRLVLTLVDALKHQTQPIVLLLEDLQWAAESLAPIKQILAVPEQLPRLLVLGTYRDDECPHLPDELPGVQMLKLSRLNDAAMADLAQSMLGESGTQPEVLNLLKRETEGNTFFMVEIVRALAEEAGRLSDIGRKSLPERVFAGGMQQVIRRRLSRVPAWTQPTLKLAAVAGRELDVRVLTAGTQYLVSAPNDLDTWLTVCADAAVMEIADGRWRFAHDKLRQTILTDLSDDERHNLHRAAALAIEAAYPDDQSYRETLMEHWRAADDATRELDYLITVVKHLMLVSANYARAIQLAEHGLTLMAETDSRRPTLLNQLSRAYVTRADYTLARRFAEQAQAAAGRLDDKPGLSDSLRNLGVIADDQGDYTTAADYFQQSLFVAREIGDRFRISVTLNSLGVVAYHQGDYDTTADYYQQSLAIARDIGNPFRVAVTLGNLGTLAHSQGDYATAIQYGQQSLTITREIGDRQGLAFGLNNLGLAFLGQNDLSRAVTYLRESLITSYEIGSQALTMDILVGLGRLWLRTRTAVEAAEIAGLVAYHPATDSETRSGELANLNRELEAVLPADVLGAAMERGKSLDLDAVVKQLLADQS